jgi:hypothetical protein
VCKTCTTKSTAGGRREEKKKKEEEENRGGEMLFQKNVLFCCLHQDLKGKQRKVSRSVDLFLVFFLIDFLIEAQMNL